MYYVTETQLKQILAAVKALPVRADNFDVADAWVGLYLTIQHIGNQPVPTEKEDSEAEGE